MRPEGIPTSLETRAKLSEIAKARWRIPSYRKKMMAALKKSQPKALAAYIDKNGGPEGVAQLMRGMEGNRCQKLPPMTPAQRCLYRKVKILGISRDEALKAVMGNVK